MQPDNDHQFQPKTCKWI